MSIDFKKMIREKYPDVDYDRYRFQQGDIVDMPDGAKLLIYEPLIMECLCYVLKRSIKYNQYVSYKVPYTELPRYMEQPDNKYTLNTKLKWKVGSIVEGEGVVAYLYEETHPQAFYGFVLRSNNPYYLHTGIYMQSPIYYYM